MHVDYMIFYKAKLTQEKILKEAAMSWVASQIRQLFIMLVINFIFSAMSTKAIYLGNSRMSLEF